jgi:Uma2 family endonuclease
MSSTLQRVRFTRFEYMRMASILGDRRTELIDGEIIEMAPIGTPHMLVVTHLQRALSRFNEEGRLLVQQPIVLDEYNEPQPDIVVLREPLAYQKPHAADCLAIIEVADTTYATDVAIKVPAYLRAGAPTVWIVNISNRINPLVEVWTLGLDPPAVATSVVTLADMTVTLDDVFEGLSQISP